MQVVEQKNDGYLLRKGTFNTFLPLTETTSEQLDIKSEVKVFLQTKKATEYLPKVVVGLYNWVEVVDHKQNIGFFVDIGTSEPILIPEQDLPPLEKVWPKIGDALYITLKKTSKDRLIGVIAKERDFAYLFERADDVDLNDRIQGTVIRTGREGTVLITKQKYRGFIHRTERQEEPRLGEMVTARVIEVKEDGSLNMSLLPLKHERIEQDAMTIKNYLIANDGEMPFNDKSNPKHIQETFHMSKSAFKRALGHLMKNNQVKQTDTKTKLLQDE